MKNALLVVVFLLSFWESYSQSSIAPIIGLEYSNVRVNTSTLSGGGYQTFDIFDNPYSVNAFLLGIKGEKKITELYSLSLFFSFTQKKVNGYLGGPIVPSDNFEFNIFRGALLFMRQSPRNWRFGLGPSLLYTPQILTRFNAPPPYKVLLENKRELGIMASVGYLYKNILAEIYFEKGIPINKQTETADFKPVDSFGITLGYLFQVGKWR